MNSYDAQRPWTELNIQSGAFCGGTHIGLQRPTNEDHYLIKSFQDGAVLLAVADGLGLGGTGKQAAEMIMQTLAGLTRSPGHPAESALHRLVCALDRAVFEAAAADMVLEGMGSTLICVLLQGDRLDWVHAGDSRLYLWRGGILTQVTADQTLARFLLAEGETTPEKLAGHYAHQVMDQYVGCGHCAPDTGQFDLEPGDLLLLCSDGVHRPISFETLSRLLDPPADLKIKARAILKAALDAGGSDNLTLVMARR